MAAQHLLDFVKPTLPAQNLGESPPGTVMCPDQDMEEARPGIKHLLQRPGTCEVWHDFGIDGGLIRPG